MIKNCAEQIITMVKEGNYFRRGILDISLKLIVENIMDEELNEKFDRTVEKTKKIINSIFAITTFLESTL